MTAPRFYGDPAAFRDHTLAAPGTELPDLPHAYYAVSPTLVKWFGCRLVPPWRDP